MDKVKKSEITNEIKELLDSSSSIYLTDFTGMTVEQVDQLRNDFYKEGIKYKVVKNTLALRALKESKNFSSYEEKIKDAFKGSTGIVFSGDDPVMPAKVIKKFFDKTEKPKLKVAIIEAEVYGSKQLNELASLLSKNDLIAGIVGCLNSPVSGIVGSINSLMRDLASVIEESARKKAA
jgi:large subunit ribosomal protein L10